MHREIRSIALVEHMTPSKGLQTVMYRDVKDVAKLAMRRKVVSIKVVEGRYLVTYRGKIHVMRNADKFFNKSVDSLVKSLAPRRIEVEQG